MTVPSDVEPYAGRWVLFVAAIAALLFLTGCKTTANITCPQLYQYSKGIQAEFANEQDLVKQYAPRSKEFLDDYLRTRDAIRACHKRKKP